MTVPELDALESALNEWIDQDLDRDCVRALVDARSIERLTSLLEETPDIDTRETIIDGLAGETSPGVADRLAAILGEPESRVVEWRDLRVAALEALNWIVSRAVEELGRVVADAKFPRYLRELALVLLDEGTHGLDPRNVRTTDDLAALLNSTPPRTDSGEAVNSVADYDAALRRAARLEGFEFIGTCTEHDRARIKTRPDSKSVPEEADPSDPALFWFEPLKCAFVLVPGGEGPMGDPEFADAPRHSVTVAPFLIAQTVVPREAWTRGVDERGLDLPRTPWTGDSSATDDAAEMADPQFPVTHVTWDHAWTFLRKLGLWLPTDAEWERACRAGSKSRYCFGDDPEELLEYGWFRENSQQRLHPVAEKKPNDWAIYDAHGLVWEWCHDVYSQHYYDTQSALETDPLCLSGSRGRVVRGGSFWLVARSCASACRGWYHPSDRDDDVGFRPTRPLL